MLIGAAIGFGITTLVDCLDDGEAFNGSVHWGWYLGATLVGAAIGAGVGMGLSYYATGKITSSTGNVLRGLFGKTYYRTMSTDDYAYLKETGKLRWSGGRSETFITKSSKYAKNKYSGITVRFRVNKGALNSLKQIGVRNKSLLTAKKYPNMPLVKKGWMQTNAFFKAENRIINIGLGSGQALDIFNSGIIWFSIV